MDLLWKIPLAALFTLLVILLFFLGLSGLSKLEERAQSSPSKSPWRVLRWIVGWLIVAALALHGLRQIWD